MAKNINKLDWVPLTILTDEEVFGFFKRSEYKYRRTHSDTSTCNVHDTCNDHASTVAYYTWVAKRCVRGEKERCPSRKMLKR